MVTGDVEQALETIGLKKLLKYSYLNLDFQDYLNINNPLMDVSCQARYDNPVFELLDFMRQPENFAYTCKWLLNIDLLPFQGMILNELWIRKFPMLIASRGAGKSWILALYGLLRALFCQGSKVIFVGASFRQSKILFEYVEAFWRAAPILRHMVGSGLNQGPKHDTDRYSFYIGDSVIHALPIGTGEKIRGMRGTHIISDEFDAINPEIFEVVIKGFGAVHVSPVNRIKKLSNKALLYKCGMVDKASELEDANDFGNQSIISGTAGYSFKHFYQYWKNYKAIIKSCGNEQKLTEIFQGPVPKHFDWKQYGVIRIPYEVLPEGLMDVTQIAQAKALMHVDLHRMEYSAIFTDDSKGFFKRSVIEGCTTTEPISKKSGDIQFKASVSGNHKKKHVIAIDPASESDNFSIVILELGEDHRRIVYSWTVSREKLSQRLKKRGKQNDQSYYNYCARKIRDLMKIFPTDHIAIDKQGGGIPIIEALHDTTLLKENEQPIWPYTVQGDHDPFWWEDKDKPTDAEKGLHILHVCQFANSKFIEDANHGMRKDLEMQELLFPYFDSAEVGLSMEQDVLAGREYDTLEDCVLEIEELKNELTTIVHTSTTTGRDKWDTPEIKTKDGRKGRLRKDRYSSLLIGNMIARTIDVQYGIIEYNPVGGYVGKHIKEVKGPMYSGPDSLVKKIGDYGCAVVRR
jgi:hypothetical protein